MLYPDTLYIFQCENIVSSFIFARRLAMPYVNEQDKSHTFYFYLLLLGTIGFIGTFGRSVG